MKILEAKKMAVRLRNLHDLNHWNIRFAESDYGCDILGTTFEMQELFEFSPKYFALNSKEFCKDTILHEIAHALAGYDAGHGKEWRKKCVEIGAVPYELWEGYHSFKSPFGSVVAHRVYLRQEK